MICPFAEKVNHLSVDVIEKQDVHAFSIKDLPPKYLVNFRIWHVSMFKTYIIRSSENEESIIYKWAVVHWQIQLDHVRFVN
jgi:hypothetical protein